MLSLTRKTDYALVALALLGRRRTAGEGPVSARLVAEEFGLPRPLLMNILKELAQAKIVTSTRGATGGYTLAHDPDQITVLEVITAIEGPVRLAQCCDGLPIAGQGCAIEAAHCPAKGAVQKLHQQIIRFFEEMTLQDLLDEADDAPADAPAGQGQCCLSLSIADMGENADVGQNMTEKV